MSKKKKLLSAEEKIIQGLENFADALESGEDVTKLYTCRKVILNLQAIEYTPEMVKKARKALGVSQALFAQFIGASLSSVQKWESGEREPSTMACRFMDELLSNPRLYRKRFKSFVTPVAVS